jgi:segregation and condensation protein B
VSEERTAEAPEEAAEPPEEAAEAQGPIEGEMTADAEATATGDGAVESTEAAEPEIEALACTVEALLFLSSDPVSLADLAEATAAGQETVTAALELLEQELEPGRRGLRLKEVGGGYLLASAPEAEDAAKRLFSRPRIATLTPAQAETLAIVAYLQPISRPEIGRIRGVSADSATATLLERGLIEESGRSQFGATLYRTSTSFMKLFGLGSLKELPDLAQWDPSPEEQSDLRERLLRAGEARSGGGPATE